MADRRISELPVIPAVAGDDALAIVDTSLSETNKVSVEDLLRSAPAGTAAAPSIAFVDDPDTGFYRSAANEVSISTNGGQRVVVDDAGNVGIGTTNPEYKLDVLGGAEQTYLRVRAGEINNWIAGILLGDEGSPAAAQLFYNNGTNAFVVNSNGSERMRIDSTGRVGIGTSSPQRPLQIDAAVAAIRLKDTDTTSYTELIQDFGVTQLNQVNGGNIRFGIDGEKMRIDSAGNVGIGTSSPGAELEISSDLPQFRLTDETDSSYAELLNNNGSLSIRADESNVAASSYMDLRVDGTEHMRIRSNGVINFANCPTYADDTAAGTGGLVAGDVYKTSTGELRIKL